MRRFHSYGPVDCRYHFCVDRQTLVERCIDQLVGIPDQGGHYFTIWAPRQTGKTWLMRQMREGIPNGTATSLPSLTFRWALRVLRWPSLFLLKMKPS
jgi:hypothetical protein